MIGKKISLVVLLIATIFMSGCFFSQKEVVADDTNNVLDEEPQDRKSVV